MVIFNYNKFYPENIKSCFINLENSALKNNKSTYSTKISTMDELHQNLDDSLIIL